MSNKIGLLLPRSVIYPTIAFDMMAGLKQGLADLGISDVEIKSENIGIGAESSEVFAACERLILDECLILVGYINLSYAETIEPLLAGVGAVFIALDAGYQYPPFGIKKMPHFLTISLDGALCCRILSEVAVADGCKRMAFVGSYYEAGYRSVHGFAQGLQDAGGAITFNHITQLKRADFTLSPLAAHLADQKPDGILASFCGDMLEDFCTAAAADVTFASQHIYGSPFMADEIWLAQCPYPGVDFKVATTWAGSLQNPANVHFRSLMAGKKLRANIWSMLTWEASRLIAVALMYDADAALTALEGLQYEGVRGMITMEANTNRVISPVYIGWVRKDPNNGKCMLEIEGLAQDVALARARHDQSVNEFVTNPSTNWKNTYACLES
jgi:branched-chain amino acid transport system substrate-binding protein